MYEPISWGEAPQKTRSFSPHLQFGCHLLTCSGIPYPKHTLEINPPNTAITLSYSSLYYETFGKGQFTVTTASFSSSSYSLTSWDVTHTKRTRVNITLLFPVPATYLMTWRGPALRRVSVFPKCVPPTLRTEARHPALQCPLYRSPRLLR